MKTSLIAFAASLTLTLSAAPARAGFVFNNFGPGDTFNTATGWAVGPPFTQGMQFTASGSGALSTIELALGSFAGSSTVTVELHADASGTVGALLATGTTTTGNTFGSAYPPSVTTMSAATITSGAKYWVVVTSPDLTGWNWNSTGSAGLRATSTDGGSSYTISPSQTLSAFRVSVADASPVPAPPAAVLFALGAVGLVAFRRFRGTPSPA